MKKELLELIRKEALFIGEFKLSSGKSSNYYIDCRRVTLHPKGSYLVGRLFLEEIKGKVDAVGGLTLGADPIVSSIVSLSYEQGTPIYGFIVRKEQKKHGMMKEVEGNLKEGWKVAIVDDVLTTGTSILKAIKVVEKYNCEIKEILVIVDREEEKIEDLKKYKIKSLFKIGEILEDKL